MPDLERGLALLLLRVEIITNPLDRGVGFIADYGIVYDPHLTSELDLHSRSGRQIENLSDRNPPYAGMIIACEALKAKYTNCRHRPVGPTAKFNCHGLTFASRRTRIDDTSVDSILIEDEYQEIHYTEVLPGDIVVYRNMDNHADPEHSGIVVEEKPMILVLSKWGDAHEAIHPLNDGPYSGAKRFYRIKDEPQRI